MLSQSWLHLRIWNWIWEVCKDFSIIIVAVGRRDSNYHREIIEKVVLVKYVQGQLSTLLFINVKRVTNWLVTFQILLEFFLSFYLEYIYIINYQEMVGAWNLQELKRRKNSTSRSQENEKSPSPNSRSIQLNITEFYPSTKVKHRQSKQGEESSKNADSQGNGGSKMKRKMSSPDKIPKSARRRLLFD